MIPKQYRNISGVGVLFYSKNTNRILYLLRNHRDPVWGIPGGKIEKGESLSEALERECLEEIGWWPENAKLYPIECYTSPDGKFSYNTFFCLISDEFIPLLNEEHLAYAWCDDQIHPRPLHGGLNSTLNYPSVRQKIETIIDANK